MMELLLFGLGIGLEAVLVFSLVKRLENASRYEGWLEYQVKTLGYHQPYHDYTHGYDLTPAKQAQAESGRYAMRHRSY